jgi:hypothetical protein
MRNSRRIWVALAAWLALMFGAGEAVAQAQPGRAHPASSPTSVSAPDTSSSRPPHIHCPATGINGSPTSRPPVELEPYFKGDWRLGPAKLPTRGPVGELLRGYDRTDELSSSKFLDCYWDASADGGRGGWRYPPNDGFAGTIVAVTLSTGQFIDRFGPNDGRFLAPFGVIYARRSLPPSNLDTFDPRYPNNYHIFRVIKEFRVDSGTAAPWFGQPGGGLQYRLNSAYFDGEVVPPARVDAQWLIDHGYLEPVN